MTLEDRISKRISYLRIQIIHEGRLDGWTLEGHKKELEYLEKELQIHARPAASYVQFFLQKSSF